MQKNDYKSLPRKMSMGGLYLHQVIADFITDLDLSKKKEKNQKKMAKKKTKKKKAFFSGIAPFPLDS